MRLVRVLAAGLLAGSAFPAPLAFAQDKPVLLRESFSIGGSDGIMCQVQDRSIENPARLTMFDRRWAVVCRDSAQPVASVYAFREPADRAMDQVARTRQQPVECTPAPGASGSPGGGVAASCRLAGTELGWSIHRFSRGGTTYIAEGFSAYDSATALALRSLVENAVADGTIDVATTSVTDPLAFARLQAETLSPQQALAEGYRRNLGGEYAEAAAYFETLQQRLSAEPGAAINAGEFLINRALQKSNMGAFAEADRLFAEAAPLTADDPVLARLQRNFEAVQLLNRGFYSAAIERLDAPIRPVAIQVDPAGDRLEISQPIAMRLNGGEGSGLLGFVDELSLSQPERVAIIDAQALQLRGTAERMLGNREAARAALLDSHARAMAVRNGRVTSIARLRAQILGDLALISEREGGAQEAEQYLRNGISILEAHYPDMRAVSGAKARLAALLLRGGKETDAVVIYREVVENSLGRRDATTGLANQLAPYFRLLAPNVASDPAAAEDFFRATQVLVRPGVADTQAILARGLSAGSSEAARLFRQSVSLTREIEKLRVHFAGLGAAEQTDETRAAREELATRIAELEEAQQRTQVQLNAYPQYRAVASPSLALGDLRQVLEPGEAFARLAVVGEDLFLFYADRDGAEAHRIGMSAEELSRKVDLLRASIALYENGRLVTYPYDIELARELYLALFEPVAERLGATLHLIFEPDGALLRLPIDILVADDASVERYIARAGAPGGDAFDFTGVNWLARTMKVSTAVSGQAFVDVRGAKPSQAARAYLGLGRNAPLGENPPPAIKATLASGGNACGWSVAEWNRPIADAELVAARRIIGDSQTEIITGPEFTDTNILEKPDIGEFRVLHFATHGLVTPPNPACPARPALLTSFDSEGSDGLLSFNEIFELRLDADVVILSACDTAGKASVQATREAGLGSGGGTALDGLVRSFIGAGARSVMASHWPAPDDFRATERLINGMFREGRTEDIGDALRKSQQALMDDPETSHPYYWGGFAIIGDSARPMLTGQTGSLAGLAPGLRPADD